MCKRRVHDSHHNGTAMQIQRDRHLILRSIAMMVVAMGCMSVMNIFIRMATESIHAAQLVFLRNVFSLCLIVPWMILRKPGLELILTSRPTSHMWRAGIGFCAMELWFLSHHLMPLNTATALSFTTPVIGTLFAAWILKETIGIRRGLAVAVGFIGAMVIIRPDSGTIETGALVVLASSALMALAGVLVKNLTKTEAPETIVFYMSLFMTPLSLIPALLVWKPIAVDAIGLAVLVALFSTFGHLLMANAYRHAEMVVLLPFDFTRLIFTAILAYFFLGETLDAHTVFGTLIIMASAVYIVHREAIRRRQKS